MNMLLSAGTMVYVGSIFALAIFAKKRVRTETDFLVSGRRLSTFFSATTLFATWFGAGTLLTATDAIYKEGLQKTALEPFGAGSCLLLAGLFFAKPLWELKILTVPDLFALKFGKTAEMVSALLLIPGYFGWIAVQITALAGIVHLFFNVPIALAMALVTAIAITLACLGGMWSVVLTDSVQMVFVGVVILVLAYVVITAMGQGSFGGGLHAWVQQAAVNREWSIIREEPTQLYSIFNVFIIAALGNIPGQDLAQRIFAAKSSKVAKRACLIAGGLYVFLGSISIVLGIAARNLLPGDVDHSVIPKLALQVLSPELTMLLILSIMSIIISTMDSAMLATSSIISHNLLKRFGHTGRSHIFLCRLCIVVVGVLSLTLAFMGENAYVLLEQSYAISLVAIFAPFLVGLFQKGHGHEYSAILSMLTGVLVWALSFFHENPLLNEIVALLSAYFAYYLFRNMVSFKKLA